jgi:CHAT domain-containing protein
MDKKSALQYADKLDRDAMEELMANATTPSDYSATIEKYRLALAIRANKRGWNSREVASSLGSLTHVLVGVKPSEARWCAEERCRLLKKRYGDQKDEYWEALSDLADVYHKSGLHEDEIRSLEQAVALSRKAAGELSWDYQHHLGNIATCFESHNMSERAETTLIERLRVLELAKEPDRDNINDTFDELISLYRKAKRKQDAEAYVKRKNDHQAKSTTTGDNTPTQMPADPVDSLEKAGKIEDARNLLVQRSEQTSKENGIGSEAHRQSLDNLYTFELRNKNYSNAEKYCRALIDIHEKNNVDSMNLHWMYGRLEKCLELQKKDDALLQTYQEHVKQLEKVPRYAPLYWHVKSELAEQFEKQGKFSEAERTYRTLKSELEKSQDPDAAKILSETSIALAKLIDKESLTDDASADSLPSLEQAARVRGELTPANYNTWSSLANAYLRNGLYAQAQSAYENVLAINDIDIKQNEIDLSKIRRACDRDLYGDCLRLQGKYNEADAQYRLSKADFESLADPHHRDETDKRISPGMSAMYKASANFLLKYSYPFVFQRLGLNYWAKGDLKSAEQQFRDGLATMKRTIGNGSVICPFTFGLAQVLEAQGRILEAEPLYREHRKMKLQDKEWTTTEALETALKQAQRLATNKHTDTIDKEQLETLKRAIISGDSKNTKAQLALLKGKCLDRLTEGQLANACEVVALWSENSCPAGETLELWQTALEERRKLYGKDSLAAGRTLSLMGLVLARLQGSGMSQMKEAFEIYQAHSKVTTGDTPGDVEDLLILGRALSCKNLKREAAAIARKAHEAATLTKTPVRRCRSLTIVGDFNHELWDLGNAKACYEQALTCASPEEVGSLLSKLSKIDLANHDYYSCRRHVQKALELQKKSRVIPIETQAELLQSLSLAELGLANQANAQIQSRKALDIMEQSSGMASIKLVPYLASLGQIAQAGNNLSLAQDCFKRALIISTATGSHTSEEATTRAALAAIYLKNKDIPSAREQLLPAVAIHQRNQDQLSIISDEMMIANLHLLDGARQQATSHALRGAAVADSYIKKVFPGLAFREQCAVASLLEPAVSSMISTFGNQPSFEQPYGYLLKWKGLLVEGLRRQSQISRIAKNPKERSMIEELDAVRKELANFGDGNDKKVDENLRYQVLSDKQARLERELALLPGAQQIKDPLFQYSTESFRKALGKDEVFVDLYSYRSLQNDKPHYAAVLVTSDSTRLIELGASDKIDKLAQQWLSALTDTVVTQIAVRSDGVAHKSLDTSSASNDRTPKVSESGNRDIHQITRPNSNQKTELKLSDELASLLVAPLLDSMAADVKKIWICPEGELARFPWALLISRKTNDCCICCEVDSPREFIDLHGDRKSASITSPPELRSEKKKPGILLVGGIDFAGTSAVPLPGTLYEVQNIARLAQERGFTVTLLTGKNASKNEVLSSLRDCSIVHFATHGFFASEPGSRQFLKLPGASGDLLASQNPLLLSGILISRSTLNRPSQRSVPAIQKSERLSNTKLKAPHQADSGLLTAEELVNRSLSQCQLVTLSACQTAVGRGVSGQGILGLRSAILAAGAQSVLLSLWRVDDQATARLMIEFYRAIWLGEQDFNKALRSAQDKVRANPSWSNPKYWAGWVLVGG